MKRLLHVLGGACLALAVPATTRSAHAQEAAQPASSTQDEVQALTSELSSGGLSPSRLGTLYAALARAHARAGDDAAARSAFVAALAIEPGLRLDKDEPVEVRSPFMEARGFWSLHSERLAAHAELTADGAALDVTLADPAELVARLVVRTRVPGATSFSEAALERAPRSSLALAVPVQQGAVAYALLLLDAYGNRLWQAGSEQEPLQITRGELAPRSALPQIAQPLAPAARVDDDDDDHAARTARRYRIGAAASLVVAAAAAGVGGFEHHQRQADARSWNAGDCSGQGVTRAEVCSSERDHLRRAQRAAIGLYAGAGAALTTGVILLLVARRERPDVAARRALACGPSLAGVGLDCAGRF